MKAISVIALALGCVISASATAGTLKPLEASNVQTQLADLINLYAGLEDQQQQNQILHESILRKSFGQVARSLLAGADPNSVIEGGSPVQKLLHSWDREIFDKWPLDNTDGHKRTFNVSTLVLTHDDAAPSCCNKIYKFSSITFPLNLPLPYILYLFFLFRSCVTWRQTS